MLQGLARCLRRVLARGRTRRGVAGRGEGKDDVRPRVTSAVRELRRELAPAAKPAGKRAALGRLIPASPLAAQPSPMMAKPDSTPHPLPGHGPTLSSTQACRGVGTAGPIVRYKPGLPLPSNPPHPLLLLPFNLILPLVTPAPPQRPAAHRPAGALASTAVGPAGAALAPRPGAGLRRPRPPCPRPLAPAPYPPPSPPGCTCPPRCRRRRPRPVPWGGAADAWRGRAPGRALPRPPRVERRRRPAHPRRPGQSLHCRPAGRAAGAAPPPRPRRAAQGRAGRPAAAARAAAWTVT
jgi:hypothetical protein